MRYTITNTTTEQVKSVGARNVKTPGHVPAVFAELTPQQVTKLQAIGCTVSEVGKVSATVLPPGHVIEPPRPIEATPKYNLEELAFVIGLEDFRGIFEPPLYGEGFNVAIVDTGIRETHEKINGRVIYTKNYTADPMHDGFNHGTGVASIIATIAPLCGILDLKVLDDDGEGTEEDVVMAIDDCIALHAEQSEYTPSVINLSLGAPDTGDPNNILRVACREAISEGIWVFAAAGNYGPTSGTITSPACERYVTAIGSLSYEPFVISEFSSRGPTVEGLVKPDGVLFGEDIVLASSTGDTETVAKSGTSFSVAFVTSMVVIYFEGVSKSAVTRQTLISGYPLTLFPVTQEELHDKYLPLITVKPVGSPAGKDNAYGYGLPYGPLTAKALGLRTAGVLDISSMISAVLTIGVVGMMMKMMGPMVSPGQSQVKEVVLEPYWWSKYQFKDVPSILRNPHLESMYKQASPDKQAIVQMAVGAFRDPNTRQKIAKYEYLKKQMENYDVYIDVTPKQFLTGRMEYLQVIAAGIMETFTPSGLYPERYGNI